MFTAKIAEHIIGIENRYPMIERFYNDYLTDEKPEFIVSVSENEIAAENRDGGTWDSSYLETLAVYRRICEKLLDDSIILFHCSSLMIDDKAVLFTAPSGTGKSTHSRLWRERFGDRVTMINDDKPLLRIDSSGVIVYGTPYGGKDNIQTNTSCRVAAIVVLHQAENNEIKKLSPGDAIPLLLMQTYRDNTIEGMTKTLPLLDRLAHLPVYSLGCTISQEAVEMVYNAVFK